MKTIKAIIVLVTFFIGSMIAYSQTGLSINDMKVCRGQTKNISIEMNNSVEIRALQMRIVLPEQVKLVAQPYVSSNRIGTYTDEFGNQVNSSIMVNYRIKDDGSIIIIVNSADAIPFKGNKGTILNLMTFIDEQAEINTENIEIKDIEMVCADGCTYISPSNCICKIEILDTITSIMELKQIVDDPVNVYTIDGKLLLEKISIERLEKSLKKGTYIIDGVKIIIK